MFIYDNISTGSTKLDPVQVADALTWAEWGVVAVVAIGLYVFLRHMASLDKRGTTASEEDDNEDLSREGW